LLRLSERVRIVEVCHDEEAEEVRPRLEAVVAWLGRHGVAGEAHPLPGRRAHVAEKIDEAASEIGADLIVTGGYGHSRMGEWAFGGVTRDLLFGSDRFLLMSH
jgi:nucleotide-binding universal stress UspA family protein